MTGINLKCDWNHFDCVIGINFACLTETNYECEIGINFAASLDAMQAHFPARSECNGLFH